MRAPSTAGPSSCLWVSPARNRRVRDVMQHTGRRSREAPILGAVCGRYTNTAGVQELNDRFQAPISGPAGTGRFNVAPTEQVLAIVAPRGEPEARLLRWGLIPPWAEDLKGAYKMINARVETVGTKPAYRKLIGRSERRALQIADGYFEWLKPEQRAGRSQAGPRQPFWFRVDGGVPFAFAALWTPAKVKGEWVHSVSLLTCASAPNRVASAIHDRMPVILADRDAQQAWLDPDVDEQEALSLCGALPQERLSAAPANPALNKVDEAAEGPQLLVAPA
jgi:putative SOS response-associated peptidase YedK